MTTATLGSTTLFRPEPAPPADAAEAPADFALVGGQAGFPALVAVILSLGLVGLLAVNTAVAEDAFRLHELRQQARAAMDREQAVERAVQDLRSPASLAARASGLGMVQAGPPAFLLLPAAGQLR